MASGGCHPAQSPRILPRSKRKGLLRRKEGGRSEEAPPPAASPEVENLRLPNADY
jgi:hypothetical protein